MSFKVLREVKSESDRRIIAQTLSSNIIVHKIHSATRRFGNKSKYPHRTPEIAPETPRLGVSRSAFKATLVKTCASEASTPQIR
jgi:hypothetical protein